MANKLLAVLILLAVILRGRPPMRPNCLAVVHPARLRSMINPRSICAKLAMT